MGSTMLLVAGYRFCKKRITGPKTHWFCSTHAARGCRAIIHTLEDMTVLKYMILGTSSRGRPMILMSGYRFNKQRDFDFLGTNSVVRKSIGCVLHIGIVDAAPSYTLSKI
ncbi:Modifier of mdg4 [Operophtera brumata]|uniref:Modifier of mdg4 n=1 Tax=Operophtera brumata TaxID=104452 RepID=A0A0L7LBH6_OPEBR|nr:Modifier of mdg4 [Operophtera brumata]